jgi:hypothetical protein
MIRNLSEWIIKISSGRMTLVALLVFLAFTAVVLPRQSAQSETYAGEAGSPDQSFFYTPDELYQMAEAYGQEGRSLYIRARFTFDLLWPLVYVVFLGTCLGWLCGKLFNGASRLRMLPWLPLLGGLFDYLENIAAAIVMARYPDTSALAAFIAPNLTLLKWSLIAISFAAILVLIVRYGFNRFLRVKE